MEHFTYPANAVIQFLRATQSMRRDIDTANEESRERHDLLKEIP